MVSSEWADTWLHLQSDLSSLEVGRSLLIKGSSLCSSEGLTSPLIRLRALRLLIRGGAGMLLDVDIRCVLQLVVVEVDLVLQVAHACAGRAGATERGRGGPEAGKAWI